jgi:hypothetical protein
MPPGWMVFEHLRKNINIDAVIDEEISSWGEN